MKELVRLRTRPSRDGKRFTYILDYVDENGKRRRTSLGHADSRKAERQQKQKERELRMGILGPESMKLSDFLEDSLARTGDQIRESTACETENSMLSFIQIVGDIDYQQVNLRHGEVFRQKSLDEGSSRATVAKKLRHLKRLFQLAVDRKQLDENPFRLIKAPKSPKKKVHIFKPDECERLLRAAREYQGEACPMLRWDLLIAVGLTTGLRRGELLNATWRDIEIASQTIEVNPKTSTGETWEWHIKDTDRRTLPLTDEVTSLLVDHQNNHPEGYPYVFVPPHRYDRVQELRKKGEWTLRSSRQNLIHNFTRQFRIILRRANIQRLAQFHDLRRTALSNWLANGMGEYDVMILAGHGSFDTTHEFYLAIREDMLARARQAASRAVGQNLARAWHAPCFSGKVIDT